MRIMDRRKFMTASLKSAAGLGILAGCNSRTVMDFTNNIDTINPSAPVGVMGSVTFDNRVPKEAKISWDKHDLTDINGNSTEEEIIGYNVYCNGNKVNASPIKELSYNDTAGPDGQGLKEKDILLYQVSAIDKSNNEGPLSIEFPIHVMPPAPVYKITSDEVIDGLTINKAKVKEMIQKGIMALTGESTIVKAYETLFPNLNRDKKIAIKINCLARGKLCTHVEVIEGIIDGFRQMSFPLSNITVFDDRQEAHLTSVGYVLYTGPNNYQVVTVYGDTPGNWVDEVTDIAGSPQKFCRIIADFDYVINVPVLKDHSSAGVTFALKNFFGVINSPGNMHDTECDPYISEVYKKYADKVKLIVGDAILGAHKNGPSANATFIPKSILVSTDPVAIDLYTLQVINRERLDQGMPEISVKANETSKTDARHLVTSATEKYSLGTLNKEIKEVQI